MVWKDLMYFTSIRLQYDFCFFSCLIITVAFTVCSQAIWGSPNKQVFTVLFSPSDKLWFVNVQEWLFIALLFKKMRMSSGMVQSFISSYFLSSGDGIETLNIFSASHGQVKPKHMVHDFRHHYIYIYASQIFWQNVIWLTHAKLIPLFDSFGSSSRIYITFGNHPKIFSINLFSNRFLMNCLLWKPLRFTFDC